MRATNGENFGIPVCIAAFDDGSGAAHNAHDARHRAVEKGALDCVVPVTSHDEIRLLTRSFNSTADQLRAIDRVRVVGKSEPERVFELLGRKGEVPID
jgi:HAMP domain